MNTFAKKQVVRLLVALGSPPAVAEVLGLHPRSLRRCCHVHMSNTTRYAIRHAANALFLRVLIRELLVSGALDKERVRTASAVVRERLEDIGRLHKKALNKLGVT